MHLPCGWCTAVIPWAEMPLHLAGTIGDVPACQKFAAPGSSLCASPAGAQGSGAFRNLADPEGKEDSNSLVTAPRAPHARDRWLQIRFFIRRVYAAVPELPGSLAQAAGNKCKFPHDLSPERKKTEDFDRHENRMLRSRHITTRTSAGVEIECKNAGSDGQKCGKKYAAKDWQEHGKECEYKLLMCGQGSGSGSKSSGCVADPCEGDGGSSQEGCDSSKEECPYGCGQEILTALMNVHKQECPNRKVEAHPQVSKGHGKTESVPHRAVNIHLEPYLEHPGKLERHVGRTFGAVFGLGISQAWSQHRKWKWSCCNEDEDVGADRCSRRRWKCGDCERQLQAPPESGVFQNTTTTTPTKTLTTTTTQQFQPLQ
ncbi:unnamed protein product [Symbiodinium natans]|uniref:TRAF-type domain-containing protein n=1 Tax=Symbiodinium natans TaxID=878477 RepID=A0A812R2F4_9DINO|nr:unnamed protein product [Symbiodinium natans]